MAAPALSKFLQGLGAVSADNLCTFQQTCDNFAQLRAFSGLPGIQVFVRGAVTIADGYQGVFYWNATTQATDNGQTTIKPTGSGPMGAWVLIPPGAGQFAVASPGETLLLGWSYNVVTANPVTTPIYLPAISSGAPGAFLYVQDETNNATTNNVTIQAQPGQTILSVKTSTSGNTFPINSNGKLYRFTITSTGIWIAVGMGGA